MVEGKRLGLVCEADLEPEAIYELELKPVAEIELEPVSENLKASLEYLARVEPERLQSEIEAEIQKGSPQ